MIGDAVYRHTATSFVAQPEAEPETKPKEPELRPRMISQEELTKVIVDLVNAVKPRQLREFAKIMVDRLELGDDDVKDVRMLDDGRFLVNPTIVSGDDMKRIVKDVLGFYFKSDQDKIVDNAWRYLGLGDVYTEKPKAVGWGKFSVTERGVGERKYKVEERERVKKEKKVTPFERFVDHLRELAGSYGHQTERAPLKTAVDEVITKTKAAEVAKSTNRGQRKQLVQFATEAVANATGSEAKTYYAMLLVSVLDEVFVGNERYKELLVKLMSDLKKHLEKNPEFLSLENMPEDVVKEFSEVMGKEASDEDVLVSVVRERPWRRRA
jgi:hypothetical protein